MNRTPDASLAFAIIGCGRIAGRHAGHIRSVGRLVAVCDIDPDKAKALAADHGAEPFPDADAMLSACGSGLDVVAVCSPNGLHAEHTIKAFKAGCHVLCEKPMAISVHDCGAMIQAGEQANKRLFIVKQNRYNPPVEAVKALLDDGRLGRVYSAHLNCFWNREAEYFSDAWRGTRDLDGGCLYTQFSHFIDLLYWMLGDVSDVSAMMENFCHQGLVDYEDTGSVLLRFYSGAIGSIDFTVNSYAKNMEGSLTLFCERGTVKIGGQYLNVLEYQSLEGPEIEDLPEGGPPNEYGSYQGSMSNHGKVYENLVSVLDNDGVIGTAAFEGLKTVEIISRIYAAARCGSGN